MGGKVSFNKIWSDQKLKMQILQRIFWEKNDQKSPYFEGNFVSLHRRILDTRIYPIKPRLRESSIPFFFYVSYFARHRFLRVGRKKTKSS